MSGAFDRGLLLFSREQTSRRTVVTTRRPLCLWTSVVAGDARRALNVILRYSHVYTRHERKLVARVVPASRRGVG